MKRLRVLVVEDSLTIRRRFCEILAADPELEVSAKPKTASGRSSCARLLRPDVMTLDMVMPVMSGVTATEYIMAYMPTPILIVSASTNRGELFKTYDALAAGAVDVLEKPTVDDVDAAWERRFIAAVKLIARIKVITHPRARLSGTERSVAAAVRRTPLTVTRARRRADSTARAGITVWSPSAHPRAVRRPSSKSCEALPSGLPRPRILRAAHRRAVRRGVCGMARQPDAAPGGLRPRR